MVGELSKASLLVLKGLSIEREWAELNNDSFCRILPYIPGNARKGTGCIRTCGLLAMECNKSCNLLEA